MKKTIYLLVSMLVISAMLVGCTAEQQALWDANLKSNEVTSFAADLEMAMSLDGEEILYGINIQSVKTSDMAMKIYALADMKMEGMSVKFDLWYDLDFTNPEDIKALIVYKLPTGLDPSLTKDYYYMDLKEMFAEIPADYIKGLVSSDSAADLMAMFEGIDYSGLSVTKAGDVYTASISNEFIQQYIDSIMSAYTEILALESLGVTQEMVDMISAANIFGSDGLSVDITLEGDGYFSTINTEMSINTGDEAMPSVDIAMNTSFRDYNAISAIEMPVLTADNSASLMDMMNNTAASIGIIGEGGDDNIYVVVNGNLVEFDVPPVLVNDRTMVPMRAIFEALDAVVEYDADTLLITATSGEDVITHTIGENTMFVNGAANEMDVVSFEQDGRTLVPARFVADALGANVIWVEELNMVFIEL